MKTNYYSVAFIAADWSPKVIRVEASSHNEARVKVMEKFPNMRKITGVYRK